ncbi:MAG: hypothetical protein E7618_03465 [Ruminococcaceae bacterium]|nr:hypothetical protein [Oscillospiraceae bacterium]
MAIFKHPGKRIPRCAPLLLLSCLLALLLPACANEGNESDTESNRSTHASTESNTTATIDPNGFLSDKTDFVLQSKTTSLGLAVNGNRLSITSLLTESGIEKVGNPADLALPSSYGNQARPFDWHYLGYRGYDDGAGGIGYCFCFQNESPKALYELYVVARPAMAGPFEFFGYLRNEDTDPIVFRPNHYVSFAFHSTKTPTAMTFHKQSGIAEGWPIYSGQKFEGSGIYRTLLENGVTATAHTTVHQDWNASGSIPMIYLDYETNGIYAALEWTHGTLTATGNEEGNTLLAVGLAETANFKTRIPAGTTFYLPSVYLGVYDGDVDVGSNLFKHWFLNYKAPANMTEDPCEPLTQQDMQIGFRVASYGIQQIKWDYGWWSNEIVSAPWRTNEGLLEVRNQDYLGVMRGEDCATLSLFAYKANKADVKLALYVLLKDTKLDRAGVPTSVGQYGHPEWFSHINITGVANSADLGNEDCVNFYKNYLGSFFEKNHITTWRSDFEPICRDSDKDNRHYANGSDVSYWCTVGFGELVDHLSESLEGFRYESCSSGGSMKDFFTMTKASVINIDDSADFMSAHMNFYDSSYCIPAAQLQLPVNALTYTPGSPYYAGIGDYLYGLRCTLTGAVMLSNWGGTSAEDISHWPYHIAEVYNQKMKPLIKYGDLYHILPRPDGIHWDGLQYIDADTDREIKGLVMLWKPTDTEGAQKTVFLRGLKEDTLYELTFEDRPAQNCRKTGYDLMKNGLGVTIEGESGSEMIWITEAN